MGFFCSSLFRLRVNHFFFNDDWVPNDTMYLIDYYYLLSSNATKFPAAQGNQYCECKQIKYVFDTTMYNNGLDMVEIIISVHMCLCFYHYYSLLLSLKRTLHTYSFLSGSV